MINRVNNLGKIRTSKARKNLIRLFSRHFFYEKGIRIYEKYCTKFSNLRFKKNIFYEFLAQNNLQIFVIITYSF